MSSYIFLISLLIVTWYSSGFAATVASDKSSAESHEKRLVLKTLTPASKTVSKQLAHQASKVENNVYSLLLYEPTYVLPIIPQNPITKFTKIIRR